jgi:hypothetical protein
MKYYSEILIGRKHLEDKDENGKAIQKLSIKVFGCGVDSNG